MLKFKSKTYEGILVEGIVNLKAERKFKLFRNFELNIYQEESLLLNVTTSSKFLDFRFLVSKNTTEINIEILNQFEVLFNEDSFKIKVDKLYPFKKKYGEIFINDEKVGEVFFQQKIILTNILEFQPHEDIIFDKEIAFKIAFLILINIADLDGSE